jgi:streptogramin lyase/putative copper export protein/methionine-rich copper-binding protein CopC
MSNRALALVTFATLLMLAGFISPAYAHANLIRSDPPANSVLPSSPHQVTLYFTEQLEPKLSGAAVLDPTGKEVDTGYSVSSSDATILIVSLPTLPSGVYTVAWHAISAVDGHHTSGSFSFGIGNVTIPVQQNDNSTTYTFPSALEVAERWLNLLSDVIFLGGGFFAIFVWNPTVTKTRNETSDEYGRKVSSRFSRLLTFSVIVGIGATWLLLIVESIAAAGSPSIVNVVMAAYTILSSTRLGDYWTFRFAVVVAALAASMIIARAKKPSKRSWSLVLAIGLLLSLSTSLTSHNAAATDYNPAINLLSDWIHLTAVGAWVGGLAYFAVAIYSMNSRTEFKGKLVAGLLRRFSSVAVTCVGVIGITGLYNLILEVGSLSALFATAYGRILLAKIAIFAPMIGFGAFNQLVLYNRIVGTTAKAKRINQRHARWFGRFKLSIRSEFTMGVILLLVVGLLTASAPIAPTSSAPQTYQPPPHILRGYSAQGVNVTVKIFPFQVGDNHFEIDFTNPQGTSITNLRSVFVKFRYLDKNIGVSQANATASSNEGVYSLDGTYLSFSGNWQAEVWAQRSGGFDVVVPFQIDVPALSVRFSELPLSSSSEPYGITVDNRGLVWFAESGTGQIASFDPAMGTLRQYTLTRSGSRPFYLTADQNGSIWISDTQYNLIVRFETKSSTFNEYNIPTTGAVPGGIVADANGNVWFTEEIAGKIGRLIPSTGTITEFPIPTNDSIPIQVAVDQHGNVWFTESKGGKIGRLNPLTGSINEFPASNSTLLGPTGIAIDPGGEVWVTEHGGNRVTMFDPANQTFKSYQLSNNQAFPFGLAFYQQNRIWFVEHIGNAIATLDLTNGRIDTFPIPNPSSDVQLLAVDGKGNVWFTLPAIGVLGVLTPSTSGLQLQSNSSSAALTQLVLIAAAIIIVTVPLVLFLGQRRMRRRTAPR